MMKIPRKYKSYTSASRPGTQVRQRLIQKPQQVSRKRLPLCLWHHQHVILRTVKVAITVYTAPKQCSTVNVLCLCYFTTYDHNTSQHLTLIQSQINKGKVLSPKEKHRLSGKGGLDMSIKNGGDEWKLILGSNVNATKTREHGKPLKQKS